MNMTNEQYKEKIAYLIERLEKQKEAELHASPEELPLAKQKFNRILDECKQLIKNANRLKDNNSLN